MSDNEDVVETPIHEPIMPIFNPNAVVGNLDVGGTPADVEGE